MQDGAGVMMVCAVAVLSLLEAAFVDGRVSAGAGAG